MGGNKTVAIVQSNYLPWKGYFNLIDRVDEFILLDTVQFTRRDWRNRNRFKTPAGVRWLTVPVVTKGRYTQRIDETMISDPHWAVAHWRAMTSWYSRAPFFEAYREHLEPEFLALGAERRLTAINRRLLKLICTLVGIPTPLTSARDYHDTGHKTELLVGICRAAGATRYVSGPAARAYLDEQMFAEAGIAVDWMAYSGYPEYAQLYPPFDHHVSILDLIFSVGPNAKAFMRAC